MIPLISPSWWKAMGRKDSGLAKTQTGYSSHTGIDTLGCRSKTGYALGHATCEVIMTSPDYIIKGCPVCQGTLGKEQEAWESWRCMNCGRTYTPETPFPKLDKGGGPVLPMAKRRELPGYRLPNFPKRKGKK